MSSAPGISSLTELDLATLFRKAANWPLTGKAASGLAGACLWLGLGDTFYLSPSREQLHRQQTREVVLQQEVVRKAEIATNLEDNARQLQSLRGSFARLLQQLPLDTEVPALLEDITRLGTANGLVFEEIRLLDEQDRPLYIELPLQIGVIGAYHDLATFISAMAGLSRIVTVHDFTINPVGPHAGAPIRLNLLAKTYRYNDQDGTGLQVSEADLNQPSTPAENRAQRFVYDSVTLRDPFQPPFRQVERAAGRPASAPDVGRARGLLEGFAIEQFEMVGTLSRGAQTFVLLRGAAAVHRLAVGDYLGLDHGRVTAIHDSHIELVELFPDGEDAWLERSRTLALNVHS